MEMQRGFGQEEEFIDGRRDEAFQGQGQGNNNLNNGVNYSRLSHEAEADSMHGLQGVQGLSGNVNNSRNVYIGDNRNYEGQYQGQ